MTRGIEGHTAAMAPMPHPISDRVLLEICIDSVESAVAAQNGGADRVELCSALLEGGLTPSAGLLEMVRRRIQIDLAVMIRPRGGDFCYSDDEFEIMQRDLEIAKQAGANTIVFGILTPEGAVDVPRTARLVELSRPLAVTFHRAFDMAADPFAALDALIGLGVDRILTSGQERTAAEGIDLIAELVRRAGGRVSIMPGGGVTERNLAKILRATGAREIHGSASSTRDSVMRWRNTRVAMGAQFGPPEYGIKVASESRVRAFRECAGPV